MYQKIISISIALTLVFLSFGQDLEKDFKAISTKMESASSVNILVDVKVYSGKGSSLLYSTQSSVQKMGSNRKNVLGEMEFLITDDYELKIDHEERGIMILRNSKESINSLESGLSDFDVEKLEKFFSEHKSKMSTQVKLISSIDGKKSYSITGIKDISEMIVVLKNDKILRITYEYGSQNAKGQYIILNYSKFEYDTDLSSVFDTTHYFTVENDKFILNGKLKGYNIYTER